MGWLFWVVAIAFITIITAVIMHMSFISFYEPESICIILLSIAITALMWWLPAWQIGRQIALENGTDIVETHLIKQAKLGNQISGTFMLGCGSIKDTPVFFYYAETDGVYTLGYVDATKSKIIECNDTPHVDIILAKVLEHDTPFKRALFGNTTKIDLHRCNRGTPYSGNLYVPRGTVIENYSGLNL